MKTAFARVFSKDSKGLPRTWKAADDVGAANRKAQREALRVLGLLCVLRLDGGEGDGDGDGEAVAARQEAIDAALATFVPEPVPEVAASAGAEAGGGEDRAAGSTREAKGADEKGEASASAGEKKKGDDGAVVEYPTEWAGENDDAVMLGPAECRSVWRQFEADTAYAVSQALAAKEAAGAFHSHTIRDCLIVEYPVHN